MAKHRMDFHSQRWLFFVCTIWLPVAGAFGADTASSFRTAAAILGMDSKSASAGEPVQVKGVVTYYDSTTGALVIQDETGGIAIHDAGKRLEIRTGDEVEVQGVTDFGAYRPIIDKAKITVVGPGMAPVPKRVSESELMSGNFESRWVEFEATVRSVSERSARIMMTVVAERERIEAIILNLPQFKMNRFVGTRVKIDGVCVVLANKNHELVDVQLLVPRLDDISVVENAPESSTLPVRSIFQVTSMGMNDISGFLHVRGVIIGRTASGFIIDDKSGNIEIHGGVNRIARPGTILDIIGFHSNREPIFLEDTIIKRVGVSRELFHLRTPQEDLPTLLTVAQVRDLPEKESNRAYPVRLRGVITYVDRDWKLLFFQGATEGIYVETSDQALDLRPGDLAVLRGFTGPGAYAPIIIAPEFELQGESPMPPPREVKYEDIISGRIDSLWVEIAGTIYSITNDAHHLFLEVVSKNGSFEAIVPEFADRPLPRQLLDAKVKLTGVCGTIFNQNRQLLGGHLYVPSLLNISAEALNHDPFSDPPQPINSLLGFTRREEPERRVHVRGVVLLQKAGTLYLQDQTAGVAVHGVRSGPFGSGTAVDAIGIPTLGEYTPTLQNGRIRRIARRNLPSPMKITAEKALSQNLSDPVCDGRWVQIDARVLDYGRNPTDEILVLQNGQSVFAAHLEKVNQERPLAAIKKESRVRLTGVCVVQVDEARAPRAFRILLPSAAQVAILEEPPWWTLQTSVRVSSALAIGGLLAGFWVLTLQRRVRTQTALIQSKLQIEAGLQEQLVQAQKMESIGRLAGGVAHDFNNILTVVQGHCSLLATETELSELGKESVDQINGAAERAARLTRQMLTLSRKQVMEQKVQDLNTIIEDMSKMLKRMVGEDITVSVNSDRDTAFVRADRGMIEQVVLNLAVNSRDAMPKGGAIQINVDHARIDSAYLRKRRDASVGEMVRLRFSDKGCGIPEENLSRIFEPFFTTKDIGRGTGLGLATVYGIVKQHAGWIEVNSKVNAGTTFDIFLPEAGAVTDQDKPPLPKNLKRGHENILLVEDEGSLRQLVKTVLTNHGYRVTEAGSGPEAMALWPELADVDLLLTDLVMPDGMTGRELAENLRRQKPDLKVLFTSGYSPDIAGKDFPLEDGVNFLPKPFGSQRLTEIVRSCLDS